MLRRHSPEIMKRGETHKSSRTAVSHHLMRAQLRGTSDANERRSALMPATGDNYSAPTPPPPRWGSTGVIGGTGEDAEEDGGDQIRGTWVKSAVTSGLGIQM